LCAAADFTGPETCRRCHERQFQSQSQTHHAKALRPIAESPLSGILDGQSLRERSGMRFAYRSMPGGVGVSISRNGESFDARLEWVFGAGTKAHTAVGRIGGEYFEHRVSWYRQSGRLGLTPGHSPAPPADTHSAAGIAQSAQTITRCFECHATAVRFGPDLSRMIPGVTCERCHGPGSEHAARGKSGAILNAARFSGSGIVQICAQCHRSPNAQFRSGMPELEDPVSVRFAPVGFLASECFKKSKTFSCITCHDPHADPRPATDLFYTAVCRKCHDNTHSRAARAPCVGCHMKTTSPLADLTFTDHRIRVYPD
jgi:cytochrome c554/c'-like protein